MLLQRIQNTFEEASEKKLSQRWCNALPVDSDEPRRIRKAVDRQFWLNGKGSW